jgi:cytochrome c oxidase subunit 1/cytochrome c oxidase subunit I+III
VGTTAVDGEPDVSLRMPGDTPAPLLRTVALCAMFTALLVHAWWAAGASTLLAAIAVLVWLWPERELGQVRRGKEVAYA